MKENDLRNGKIFIFSIPVHEAIVNYRKVFGAASTFLIRFNGKYIKIAKAFVPIDKKINQLVEEHNFANTKVVETAIFD